MANNLPFEKISRSTITLQKVTTNPDYGCDPDKRPISDLLKNGIVVINKPSGPTSHQVSSYAKEILGIQKAGHAGTLDPRVTGVLPIALENATKVIQALLNTGKEYVTLLHLHDAVEKAKLEETLQRFVGTITQLPPIKSAIKRQERQREIYYLQIIEIQDNDVLFRVGCQAGTYIRKLCHDIGEQLKVGAHMQQLVRTKAAVFSTKDMVTLQDLADAFYYYKQGDETQLRRIIKPIESAITHIPKIWITDEAISSVCHGVKPQQSSVVKYESGIKKGDMVAVLSLKGELVCLGIATSQDFKQKDTICSIARVIMDANTYPT